MFEYIGDRVVFCVPVSAPGARRGSRVELIDESKVKPLARPPHSFFAAPGPKLRQRLLNRHPSDARMGG